MISVRPGSDAYRILALVVEQPGRLDAEALGQALWRPRITSTAVYLAVRTAIRAHSASWSARASRLLGRLQEAGYIEARRPPLALPGWPQRMGEATPLHRSLMRSLVEKQPKTVSAWVGSPPPGHVQRAVADLVAWGCYCPPTHRWPTAEGIALIRGPQQEAA